jgi:acetoacetyl-CoA synthetase
VRIGTAEIYRQVEQLEEIEDSVVVGQKWENDVRVILFVKLAPGVELTDDLKNKSAQTIRVQCLAAPCAGQDHPGAGHPYTLNMKKVELAVKKVIHNQEVKNKDALRNPEALDYFAGIAELHED